MFESITVYLLDDKIGQSLFASVFVAFVSTFIFNWFYEWKIKKYIEVDREMLLLQKKSQAEFISRCQIIGLNFGQLKYADLLIDNDFEHFRFLISEQNDELKKIKQGLGRVFNFRDLERRNNQFFQSNFAFFIGFLLGKLILLGQCIDRGDKEEVKSQVQKFVSFSQVFSLFDQFYARKFNYNINYLDIIRRLYYDLFVLKKSKTEIQKRIKLILE